MTGSAFVGAPVGSTDFCPSTLRTSLVHNRRPLVARTKHVRQRRVNMGLFGLGFPELAVIAGVGIFIFGPKKIAELGKDLGGIAGSVKKATGEFQEAMEESLKEADAELEKKKKEKEAAMSQTVEAAATTVESAEVVEKN